MEEISRGEYEKWRESRANGQEGLGGQGQGQGEDVKGVADLESPTESTESVNITVKWRDNNYSFSLNLTSPLSELRMLIEGLTNVPSKNQKLIGLTKKIGLKLDDFATIESHQPIVKNNIIKITLIGTPDAEIASFQQKTEETVETVFNDFSHGYSPATKEWQQLQEFSQKTLINFINPPRAGKKLLVLDLDHTLLDFSSKEDINPTEMKRPFMEYFLSALYPYYDLAIWSQTGWRWLELKVTELGMMNSPNYKICFVLDKSNMFKIDSGYVKPLHLIWCKCPSWGKHNTLIVDDLDRNFVLNPQSGVLISAFYRHAHYIGSDGKKHRCKPTSSSSASSASSPSPSVSSSSSLLVASTSAHPSSSSPSSSSFGSSTPSSSQPSSSLLFPVGPSGGGAGGGGRGQEGGKGQGEGIDSDPLNDKELLLLSSYLIRVAALPDVSATDHTNWRRET